MDLRSHHTFASSTPVNEFTNLMKHLQGIIFSITRVMIHFYLYFCQKTVGNLSLPFLWAFLLCIFLESICTHGKPVSAFFVGFSIVQFVFESICTHRKPGKMQQRNFVINNGLTGVFKHTRYSIKIKRHSCSIKSPTPK